eukprot:TRINITY_DN6871_c0_g1_i1.p2 TRINITY_DN6871_c0_g1~~TRINITY_DN6871_c0_g1_i1.p2  ORF type:complete len:360 (+),score=80.35 TRINITY_DN6871_c0_g1_i1:163-1080(+)
MKMHLQHTDYGNFLSNEPSPIATTTIYEKCTRRLVKDFNHLRCQATQPLAQFLDYITYSYMIDNIVLLITGTMHGRDIGELIAKCHPLGLFETIEALPVGLTPRELYSTVLIDTPLAPYFLECIQIEDLDELNIEIIRQTLYRAYLEDFYKFCKKLGGATAEVMSEILQFEADRRVINITLNSFGTELGPDDRKKLFPSFGQLYPEGTSAMVKAEAPDQVVQICAPYFRLRKLFADQEMANKSLEECFYEAEVELNKLAFMQQFQYGIFFAYVKLKEQEVRNIVWIAECIAQDQRSKINGYIPIF